MARTPPWFEDALHHRPEHRTVPVDDCAVHYLRWGDPADPGLILVHGGAAHAEWWSFLAPMLARRYHVVAPDLSGHGDSGRRAAYSETLWAEEVVAVAADAGMTAPPVIVGHSMGGLVTVTTAALHPEALAGAILVDTPVRAPDPETAARDTGRAFRGLKTYATRREAVARFRLIPDQPCENDFILTHLARTSVRSVEGGGFQWKFDPNIFDGIPRDKMAGYLDRVGCRVAMFRGELSTVVPRETGREMYERLGRNTPLIEVPEAHHHLLLDQPLAFVTGLRAVLEDWAHSVPASAP